MELIWCGWNVPFRSTMHLRLLRLLPPLLREVSPSFTCMDADSLDAEGGPGRAAPLLAWPCPTEKDVRERIGPLHAPTSPYPLSRGDLAIVS